RFSNAVKYVFHTVSKTGFLGSAMPGVDIICTFDTATPQKVSCWVVRGNTTLAYLTGDASPSGGIATSDGKLRVHTGLHDDPFFFNLAGFKNTANAAAMATGLAPDMFGCPTNVPPSLAMGLARDCRGMTPPRDFFRKITDPNVNMGCPSDNQNQG